MRCIIAAPAGDDDGCDTSAQTSDDGTHGKMLDYAIAWFALENALYVWSWKIWQEA